VPLGKFPVRYDAAGTTGPNIADASRKFYSRKIPSGGAKLPRV